MNEQKLARMAAGIEPWASDYGQGMEYREADGMSWYDLSVNLNSIPCQTKLAIIVTCWQGQLKWLKSVLRSYRMTGAFVIMAYDNPFYPWQRQRDLSQMARVMPNPEHYLLANSVVHKHITYDADKRNGWFWDVRYAQGIVKQFKNIEHVYVTNGDCICEKPEGFKALIELLGDAEFMAGQETGGNVFHTADMLFKVDAFHRVFDYMAEMFRVPVIGSRSPEGSLAEAIHKLEIKFKSAPLQPFDTDGTVDMYTRYGQPSTFSQLLGFKNLFAEYETAGNQGRSMMYLKPYVDNYMDWLYWSGEERETICQYWATGDRRHLMRFWDRWEDSDYNRLYYPLEHYGKEPIYETT